MPQFFQYVMYILICERMLDIVILPYRGRLVHWGHLVQGIIVKAIDMYKEELRKLQRGIKILNNAIAV